MTLVPYSGRPAEPIVRVVVPGDPVGKPRARVALRGRHVHAYTPAHGVAYEAHVAGCVLGVWPASVPRPYAGAIALDVVAVCSRPKRLLPKEHGGTASAKAVREGRVPLTRCLRAGTPDVDNSIKAISDSLVKHGILRDDVLVVLASGVQLWAAVDEGPCVEVTISAVEGVLW